MTPILGWFDMPKLGVREPNENVGMSLVLAQCGREGPRWMAGCDLLSPVCQNNKITSLPIRSRPKSLVLSWHLQAVAGLFLELPFQSTSSGSFINLLTTTTIIIATKLKSRIRDKLKGSQECIFSCRLLMELVGILWCVCAHTHYNRFNSVKTIFITANLPCIIF